MYSYNKVIMVGRLTRDPEFKYVLDNVPVSNYFLAVDRPYSKNSQGLEKADFFKIVCWRKLAELSEKYLRKGKLILLEGYLQTRTYDKEGQTHYATEIVAHNIKFMDPKGNGTGRDNGSDMIAENVREFDTGELNLEEIPF